MTNPSLLLESSDTASPRPASIGTLARHESERWPGIAEIRSRRPVRFFMSREDAERLLAEVLTVNPSLAGERIAPVSVKLLQAPRSIAADTTPGHADSFVVHPPNEVFEFLHRPPTGAV